MTKKDGFGGREGEEINKNGREMNIIKLPSERECNRTIFVGYSYYAIDIGKV